jgi:hypothetical protein
VRRGRAIRHLLLLAAVVSACGIGLWLVRRSHTAGEVTAGEVNACIGLPVGRAVDRLRVGDAKWYWTDEPPGILRGVSYYPADGRRVTLYIAEGEPLFRKFSDRFEWDYAAFLVCRVGGIQYEDGQYHLDIGPAVPWQFKRP